MHLSAVAEFLEMNLNYSINQIWDRN